VGGGCIEKRSFLYQVSMMFERHGCNECQNILAELEAALAEIRLSPKLSKQLREDADLLLRLGTTEGSRGL